MLFPFSSLRSLLLYSIAVSILMVCAATANAADTGKLVVKTDPANAKVRVLYIKPKYEPGMSLEPGKYMIDVQAEGFETAYRELNITAGKTTTVTVTLKKATGDAAKEQAAKPAAKKDGPGTLFVDVSPEDARIRIMKIRPKFEQGIELEPDTYEIRIDKKGYTTQSRNARIKAGEETRLKVRLRKGPEEGLPLKKEGHGRLFVDTTPEDARVRILKIRPKFEQGIELKEGKYTIDIQKDGYETQVLAVRIRDRKATEMDVELKPVKTAEEPPAKAEAEPSAENATVTAEPNATNASVADANATNATPQVAPPTEATVVATTNQTDTADAIAMGHGKLLLNITPEDAEASIMELETEYQHGMALPVGNYTVNFIKEGFADHQERITIAEGQALTLDVALTPETSPQASAFSKVKEEDAAKTKKNNGKLFVETVPPGATVRVLNIKPKFVQGMELKAGSYRLEILADGHETLRAVARVSKRKAATYRVVLKKSETPAPPKVVTPPAPKVLPEHTKQAQTHLEEGRAFLDSGNMEKALEAFTKALESDPALAEALTLRATALERTNQRDEALADLNRAIQLYNRDPKAYLGRAKLNVAMERPEAACYDLWMACSLNSCEGIRTAQQNGLCQ